MYKCLSMKLQTLLFGFYASSFMLYGCTSSIFIHTALEIKKDRSLLANGLFYTSLCYALHPKRHEEPNKNDGYTNGTADFVRRNIPNGFHRFRGGHWPFGDNKSQHCYTNSHHWLIAGHWTDENEKQTQRNTQEQMFNVWQCAACGRIVLYHAFVTAKCSTIGGFSATILTACRHPRALLSKKRLVPQSYKWLSIHYNKTASDCEQKNRQNPAGVAIIPSLCPRACLEYL